MKVYRVTWRIEGVTKIAADDLAEAIRKFGRLSKGELAENDGELGSDDPVEEKTDLYLTDEPEVPR